MRRAAALVAVVVVGFVVAPGGVDAEAYGLRAARAALSSHRAAVIIGVPREFFTADRKTGPDEAETAGDWGFYLGEWRDRDGGKTPLVILTDQEMRQLFKAPKLKSGCNTFFVRDASHALTTNDCVPLTEVYEAGAKWAQTGAAPASALALREIEFRTS